MNITKQQLKTPLLSGECVAAKRAELKAYFRNTRATYESLFSLINDDSAYYLRPEPLRHPLIFYFGHTATFYINKLILGKYIDRRINPKFEAICAVGVDEMSWDDLNSEHYDWPSVGELTDYRDQVARLIEDLIDNMELCLPITQDSLAWIILMGCEHERIHLETSSVIMRMLPLSSLTAAPDWQACPFTDQAAQNKLLPVAGKALTLGKPDSEASYGWDNEYGKTAVNVSDFAASQYLVSNQEFLTFVEAGGYQQPQFWTEEGQQWLRYKGAQMPRFWSLDQGKYQQRNLTDEIALPLNWPVEVNYLEAKAFCNWKSEQSKTFIRLPSEPEWHCLRGKQDKDLLDWQEAPGNINLEYFASPCPVDRFEHQGLFDLVGNVWQWTESPIDGFDGFTVHPLYDDFSTPTFDGKHNLIKGGSWISTGNEATRHARFAFRRHFFQHAGFRYVQSEQASAALIPANHYETNQDICQQLQNHYGEANDSGAQAHNVANYPLQVARAVRYFTQKYQSETTKLLDLGCSVGRSSFELADYFDQIDAVDFSARYILHGVQLQQNKRVRYALENEGDIVDFKEVHLAGLGLSAHQDKIHFSQGDPCNLKAIFSGYDVVLAQHVLEKSYDPAQFLNTIGARLNPGALLILVSDYQFSQDVADKAKWLGGTKVNGENVTGFDGLSQRLDSGFSLLDQQELTRLVKVNQRHFDLSLTHLTVWQVKPAHD